MVCSRKKYPQIDRSWAKSRKVNATVSLENLMVNQLPISLEDSYMRKLEVRTDLTNGDLTRIKRKLCILDHPKTF